MKSAWFIYAVVALQFGASIAYAANGRFKLAAYWLLISLCNLIAATF